MEIIAGYPKINLTLKERFLLQCDLSSLYLTINLKATNLMNTSRKLFSTILVLLFLTASGFTILNNSTTANATQWEIDKAHSNISFEVTHFFTAVSGKFNDYTSEVYFDPENLDESSISVDIKVNSIDTDNEKRDGHLQSDDFFNAAQYPSITFDSNEIIAKGDNDFVAKGTLTIKDTSTDFEIPFTLLGVQDHPMREHTKVAGMESLFTLDRTDYGVGVDDWAATTVVGDEVSVKLALELNASN